MSRIPRAEATWRQFTAGQVRHVVKPDPSGQFLRAECGAVGWWQADMWHDDPSKPECQPCADRVEPAPTEEDEEDDDA